MTPRLAASGLSFGYSSAEPLFEGWSAEFHAGEVVAVTGQSGRGKSTLLYLLGMMLKPTGGAVLVDGNASHALPDLDRASLRSTMFGFVFQDAALDGSRSVLSNILETTLYRGDDRRAMHGRAYELMERFGVALQARAKPGQVSGGQAQRIALCRAMLGNPGILLADEPTGNLDPTSSNIVVDALHDQARRGAAVVVVTHDPALVLRCDRELAL